MGEFFNSLVALLNCFIRTRKRRSVRPESQFFRALLDASRKPEIAKVWVEFAANTVLVRRSFVPKVAPLGSFIYDLRLRNEAAVGADDGALLAVDLELALSATVFALRSCFLLHSWEHTRIILPRVDYLLCDLPSETQNWGFSCGFFLILEIHKLR
jgi:hypothetical protein